MDAAVIQIVLGGLLGSGGLAGVVTLIRTYRHKLPTDETEARRTADWEALSSYFQAALKQQQEDRAAELKQIREDRRIEVSELKQKMARLEEDQITLRRHMQEQAEDDAQHIDDLEQHIWLRNPPPPPPRRRRAIPGSPLLPAPE